MVVPVVAQIFFKQILQAARHPVGGVDSVGDVLNWHIVFFFVGPEEIPHFARDLSVQFGYAVAAAGEFEGENGHGEGFGMWKFVNGNVYKFFAGEAQLGPKFGEVLVN